MRSKFLMGLVPAFVALTALCSPASATMYVATWTGTITGGTVHKDGSLVDVDVSGEAFTFTASYTDNIFENQFFQYTNGNITTDLNTSPAPEIHAEFIGGGFDLVFDKTFLCCGIASNTTTETADTFTQSGGMHWGDDNPLTGYYEDESEIYNLTANVQTPLDLTQILPTSSITGSGRAEYCHIYIKQSGAPINEPICFDFTLSPTTLSVSAPFLAGVPEPSTWALMLFGFGMAGASMRMRRRENLVRV
ncbi:MAG TPA: PEPxxWA-CTERM sorting domain-containing protein [Rhizomicrobium sp.]|nr:PEPxxWA-CTERM sorting domain-containing protein [Rhizomicrobium sp.]